MTVNWAYLIPSTLLTVFHSEWRKTPLYGRARNSIFWLFPFLWFTSEHRHELYWCDTASVIFNVFENKMGVKANNVLHYKGLIQTTRWNVFSRSSEAEIGRNKALCIWPSRCVTPRVEVMWLLFKLIWNTWSKVTHIHFCNLISRAYWYSKSIKLFFI